MGLSSVLVGDDGIFGNEGRLGSVGGSFDISTKMVIEEFSFGGNW
jgi:hypothetical protein